MSATNAPYGILPVFHPSGQIRPEALQGNLLAAGYGTNLFKGTPLLLATDGTMTILSGTGVDLYGVFAGVEYQDAGSGRPVASNKWVAGTSYVAGTMTMYVWADPDIIFQAQADGSVAETARGDQVNTTNIGAGSALTGLSLATLGATPVGAGVQGQWRVHNAAPIVGNAWGDAFTQLQVSIARSQYVANKVAI
jgi:hypothetical protein